MYVEQRLDTLRILGGLSCWISDNDRILMVDKVIAHHVVLWKSNASHLMW